MESCAEGKFKIYKSNLNYKEKYVHESGKQCYIFFLSNGLYDDSIVEKIKDTYE